MALLSPTLPPSFSTSAAVPARRAHLRRRPRTTTTTTVSAKKGEDRYSSGKLVDEDMLVLRKRVQEVRAAEEGGREPPKEWMEWERRYHASSRYDSDVCEALGALQALLMATRPGVALAAAALVGVSVPVAVGVVLMQVVGVVRMVLLTLVHL